MKIDVSPCAEVVVVVVKSSCPCLDVKNSIIAARCTHDPANAGAQDRTAQLLLHRICYSESVLRSARRRLLKVEVA